MTQTLTTERLKELADPNMICKCSWDEYKSMAAELLANREAQPVAYIGAQMLEDLTDGARGCGRVWASSKDVLSGDDRLALYTAPPAPAVPDDYQHLKNVRELYHKQEDRLFSIAKRIKGEAFDKYSHVPSQAIDVLERAIFGEDGDACRAAMLNHSEVALDMVEPSPAMQDGWIACSERMPEEGENIITLNSSGGVFGGYVFKHGVFVDAEEEYRQDDKITHWMPLPAAPEGKK